MEDDFLDLDEKNSIIHRRASDILYKTLNLNSEIKNEMALKYLHFGYIIRLQSLMVNRNELFQLLKKDGGTYDDNSILYTIRVNSFYINLAGAIDNLSWMLHYEFELLSGVSETNNPIKIGFFKDEYFKALKTKDNIFASEIERFKEWYAGMNNFRHPSAHRLPLYCPPAVITSEDVLKKEHLLNRLENVDVSSPSYMPLYMEVHTQGVFKSLFFLNGEKGDSGYCLSRVVFDDYEKIINLSSIVIEWLRSRKE